MFSREAHGLIPRRAGSISRGSAGRMTRTLNALEPGTVIPCIGVLRRRVYMLVGASTFLRGGSRRPATWRPVVVERG